jgi:CheY-like chemotaxis protein
VPSPVQQALSPDAPATRAPRVLVVDDSKTILKVVHAILTIHGYEAVLARDGVEGLERLHADGPIDLILLDFVMPRMNGYQFCRQLRADPSIADVPVVLMSARTEAIGDRFVEQTGAMDAVGKPFDSRALVAVVGRVLERAAAGRADRHAPQPDQMMAEEELDRGPESIAPASRHFRTLGAVGRLIAEAVTPSFKRMSPEQLADPGHVASALTLSLDDRTLGEIRKTLDEVGAWGDPNQLLRGELDGIPLAELLQFFQLARQTGVLYVTHKSQAMTMYIREGMVDYVQSTGVDEEFRLGRYFVKRGLISREEIDQIVSRVPAGKLMGAALVEEGKITTAQVREALGEQSSELTYELLRWPAGRFALMKEPFSELAQKSKLGLGMSNLVLEGFRRVDEWRVMEKTIDFNAVLFVDQHALGSLDSSRMGPDELRLLKAIDGQRTVREVMAETALASFDAIQIVYRLQQSRIVRAKGSAAHPTLTGTTAGAVGLTSTGEHALPDKPSTEATAGDANEPADEKAPAGAGSASSPSRPDSSPGHAGGQDKSPDAEKIVG